MTKAKIIIVFSVIFAVIFLFLVVAIFRWGFFSTPPPEPPQTNSNPEINKTPKVKTGPSQIKKGETDPQLQDQINSLLPLFDKMPVVPIFLTDEPILKSGSETQKGVGYTICNTKDNPTIYLKKDFFRIVGLWEKNSLCGGFLTG